jgi:isoleucyl-tRNA synthetase
MLAFTAEEAWEFIPGKPTPSVHLSEWEAKPFERTTDEQVLWDNLFVIRDTQLEGLEEARQKKIIGKSLEAKLDIVGHPNLLRPAQEYPDLLRELLNVSQLAIALHDEECIDSTAAKAPGQKCERCWHWETEVGTNTEHPTLCPRCVEAVKAAQIA